MSAPTQPVGIDLSDVSDATIISLWRHIYSCLSTDDVVSGMLVCRAFSKELAPLVTNISIKVEAFSQRQLAYLARTYPNIKCLTIHQEYSDHAPKLNFSGVHLPKLEELHLYCTRLTTCSFTQHNTPQLRSLWLDNCGTFRGFELDLPHLECFSLEHGQVDDLRGFSSSLNKCPKLQRFTTYKLWGLAGGVHKLNLPECTSLELSRSDDLEGLELEHAPKLKMLGLRACYSLRHVRVMEDASGTDPVPLTVNLINANIDRVSRQHLKQHPRVKMQGGGIWTKESQEWGGLAAELGMCGDEEEDEDSNDDLSDSDDDQGAAFAHVMEAVQAAAAGDQLGADHAEFLNLMMHLSAMGVIPSGMVGGDMGMPNYYFDGEEDEEDEDITDEEEEDESDGWGTGDEEDLMQAEQAAAAAAAAGGAAAAGVGGGQRSTGRQSGAAAEEPSCVIEEIE